LSNSPTRVKDRPPVPVLGAVTPDAEVFRRRPGPGGDVGRDKYEHEYATEESQSPHAVTPLR